MPRMAVNGVRSSWLTTEMNWFFRRSRAACWGGDGLGVEKSAIRAAVAAHQAQSTASAVKAPHLDVGAVVILDDDTELARC